MERVLQTVAHLEVNLLTLSHVLANEYKVTQMTDNFGGIFFHFIKDIVFYAND